MEFEIEKFSETQYVVRCKGLIVVFGKDGNEDKETREMLADLEHTLHCYADVQKSVYIIGVID